LRACAREVLKQMLAARVLDGDKAKVPIAAKTRLSVPWPPQFSFSARRRAPEPQISSEGSPWSTQRHGGEH
jgi:hypothetical protein